MKIQNSIGTIILFSGDASRNDEALRRCEIPVAQPNQGQTIEIVTSSSGSTNAAGQQPTNETHSSLTDEATQSQQTARGTGQTEHGQQRRGIQRRPIIWDSASGGQSTSATQAGVQAAPRGMQGARGLRGPRSGRRAGRGMYGPGRGLPRGGA